MTIMGSTTWAKHTTKQADFKESACFVVSIYREAFRLLFLVLIKD